MEKRALYGMLVLVWGVSAGTLAGDEVSQEERGFFEERIRPVLAEHCYECHATDAGEIKSGFTLDTRSGIRAGGASGKPAVVPGEPDSSRLLTALSYNHEDLQMPPDGRLPDKVIADFEKWISMGAPDPRDQDPRVLKRRAGASRAGKLWSLQKPAKPEPPKVKNKKWPRNTIDHFVLARMEAQGLEPVADADRRSLIRRVYFDLVGLPPKPEEVEAFVGDKSKNAFAKVVDRLLDSPRFGERWGRHWLDVARYAESSGREFNFTYPHAWPYRDYVIDAFNEDKPYDRFVTEQIAGDLLPAKDWRERDENRLATGFLAIGPKRHNAGTSTFRMDMVDDQMETTFKAFLGLTIGCARCHDHKFDPIPTEDYYSLAGIYLSTDILYGTKKIKYSKHPSDLIPIGVQAGDKHKKYEAHLAKIKKAEEKLEEAEKELKKAKEEAKKQAKKAKEAKKASKKKDDRDGKKKSKESGKQGGGDKDKKDPVAEAGSTVARLKKEVKQLKADKPEPPRYAMGAREGKKPSDTHVAVGGDPGKKGDEVPRGFLSAVKVDNPPEIASKSSGRLELARWITDPGNPLTARVMVNRIWHHLFGRGLVSTPDNFGELGKRPSHPELLDYLAVTFMEKDWSMKQAIRSMVLSRTYRLSTRKSPSNERIDPDNVHRWRMTPKRLEVEPLRDAILAVSGELELERPEGSPVTGLGQQLARGVSPSKINPNSNHRSVYQPVVRDYAPGMFQEFDFAASSLVVGDRAETTSAQQALFLLNNEFLLEQAEATAELLLAQEPDDRDARIRLACERALSRPPSEAELMEAGEYLQRAEKALEAEHKDAKERQRLALASFVHAIFGSAEFRYLIDAPGREPVSLAATKQ